jgi:hypothetical protein
MTERGHIRTRSDPGYASTVRCLAIANSSFQQDYTVYASGVIRVPVARYIYIYSAGVVLTSVIRGCVSNEREGRTQA